MGRWWSPPKHGTTLVCCWTFLNNWVPCSSLSSCYLQGNYFHKNRYLQGVNAYLRTSSLKPLITIVSSKDAILPAYSCLRRTISVLTWWNSSFSFLVQWSVCAQLVWTHSHLPFLPPTLPSDRQHNSPLIHLPFQLLLQPSLARKKLVHRVMLERINRSVWRNPRMMS